MKVCKNENHLLDGTAKRSLFSQAFTQSETLTKQLQQRQQLQHF
jgi:hypothetical protein